MSKDFMIYSILVVLLFTGEIIAQPNRPKTLEFPYGGKINNNVIVSLNNKRHKALSFNAIAFFDNLVFDKPALFSSSTFDGQTQFSYTIFDSLASFYNATFNSDISFVKTNFKSEADFSLTKFTNNDLFKNLRNEVFKIKATFYSNVFNGNVSFFSSKFSVPSEFPYTVFRQSAIFTEAIFEDQVDFSYSEFQNKAIFNKTTFNGRVSFSNTKFKQEASFYKATFEKYVVFEETIFPIEINFSQTFFKDGVDFRDAKFDSVQVVYFDDAKFPQGKFWVDWHQLKKTENHFRIRLFNIPQVSSKKDSLLIYYERIKRVYQLLSDNYLSQGDKTSSLEVLYEIEEQKEKILDGFWQRVSGWLFGYGYKPLRFIWVIFLSIGLFAIVWYYWFYGIVLLVVSEKLISRDEEIGKVIRSMKMKTMFKILRTLNHSEISKRIKLIYRIWHSIYFSGSVLLSLRFKKEWSDIVFTDIIGYKFFLWIVSIEYVWGILLYIIFFANLKIAHFDYIKSLLGI